ncbi:hypothetical protein DFQ29_005239 [Apophysomyces sp. BC1021]|nr:hypothetical protein DFQ29_005239 [Apophysomyces sp. BC1021]
MAQESAWKDLLQWQTEIRKKDELLARRKPVHDEALPPVRPSVELVLDGQKPVGLASLNKASYENDALGFTQAEKEKGNNFFQKTEYSKAVEHYGRAIELDPTVSVYFLNRAMANLKLNKFLEVERDCTQGLQLQPQNVKALWRRGIALRELGRTEEARTDFKVALALDPGNNAIVAELNKLPSIKKPISVAPPAPKPGRTLPIKIVDAAYAGPEKSNKKHVLSPPKVDDDLVGVSLSHTPLKLECPRTNFEFERDWKSCKHRGDDMLYQYLQCIPPSSYAALFKSSLESDQFEKMIEIIDTHYCRDKTEKEIYDVLEGLSRVRRMDMLVMFLSHAHGKGSIDQDRLAKVAKIYRVKV